MTSVTGSALIVDACAPTEDGAGLLVEHLARRCFSHVVRLPYVTETQRHWSMVWFLGHTTVYRSADTWSLERREERWFYRVATLEQFLKINADLLVLATCYGHEGLTRVPTRRPKRVIAYKGFLWNEDALVFAARFMFRMAQGPMTSRRLASAFKDAAISSSNPSRWSLDGKLFATKSRSRRTTGG